MDEYTLEGPGTPSSEEGRASGQHARLGERLRRSQRRVDELLHEGSHHGAGRETAGLAPRAGPCGHGHRSAAEAQLLRLSLGRDGRLGPQGEVPEELVEAAITEVTMHEVGHTLGLRHNFRGSTAYSSEQLSDPAFTAVHGMGSSIMDYNPAAIPSDRSAQGDYYSVVVGAYDKHAIEYGYSPIEAEGELVGRQPPQLQAIAARGASRRELAFATDEDGPRSDGADPYTNVYDLGSDPIAFHTDRLALAQSLLCSAANRTVEPGEPWTRQLSAVSSFMRTALRAGAYVSKYIGGFVFSKAHRGDPRAADPVTAVSAAEQARALALALQLISQDFWLPAARLTNRLPKRVGYCGGVNEYCLGLGSANLLHEARQIRRLILMQLVQPSRLAGLQQHEWEAAEADADEAAEEADAADAADAQTPQAGAWLTLPAPVDMGVLLRRGLSVSALFHAIDATLSLPNVTAASRENPAEAKMRFEVQRVWISLLASFSADGLSESAAVATHLLSRLRAAVDASTSERTAASAPRDRRAAATAHALEDHLATLRHQLGLWSRGLPLALP